MSSIEINESIGNSVRALIQRSIFSIVLRIGRSLLVLPLLSPADLGVFRYFLAITSYVTYFHGGTLQSLSFKFANFAGSEDEAKCKSLQNLSLVSIFFGFPLSICFVYFSVDIHSIGSISLLFVLSILAAFSLTSAFMQSSYRVRRNFKLLSRNMIISDVLGFVAILIGTFFFGLRGCLVGALLGFTVSTWLGREWLKWQKSSQMSMAYIRSTMFSGLGLMLCSLINTASFNIDILLLNHTFPSLDPRLGYYSICVTAAFLIYSLVGSIAEVQSQEMLFEIGSEKQAPSNIANFISELTARESLIAVWISSVLAIGLALVIPTVLKQYDLSLPLFGQFLFAGIVLRWKTYAMFTLNSNNKLFASAVSSLVGIIGITATVFFTHHLLNDKLIPMSFCTPVGYSITSLCSIFLFFSFIGKRNQFYPFVLRIIAATSPIILYMFLWVLPQNLIPLGLIITGILSSIFCTLLYNRIFRGSFWSALTLLLPFGLYCIIRRRFGFGNNDK